MLRLGPTRFGPSNRHSGPVRICANMRNSCPGTQAPRHPGKSCCPIRKVALSTRFLPSELVSAIQSNSTLGATNFSKNQRSHHTYLTSTMAKKPYPLGRLNRRISRIYDTTNIQPPFNPYPQCLCDLGDVWPPPKAITVFHENGQSTIHAQDCPMCHDLVQAYGKKCGESYDRRTIARDILRAGGVHPRLPPLNTHVIRKMRWGGVGIILRGCNEGAR